MLEDHLDASVTTQSLFHSDRYDTRSRLDFETGDFGGITSARNACRKKETWLIEKDEWHNSNK